MPSKLHEQALAHLPPCGGCGGAGGGAAIRGLSRMKSMPATCTAMPASIGCLKPRMSCNVDAGARCSPWTNVGIQSSPASPYKSSSC